jgi:hypothetical protein
VRPSGCLFEADLLKVAVCDGRTDLDSSGLREHVDSCAECDETLRLVETLRAGERRAWEEAALPTASQVWWRARVRSRLEAAHRAERPIGVVQGVAAAVVVGVAASIVGLSWLNGPARLAKAAASRVGYADLVDLLSTLVGASPLVWLAVGLGACLVVLMPFAAWLTLDHDK